MKPWRRLVYPLLAALIGAVLGYWAHRWVDAPYQCQEVHSGILKGTVYDCTGRQP